MTVLDSDHDVDLLPLRKLYVEYLFEYSVHLVHLSSCFDYL